MRSDPREKLLPAEATGGKGSNPKDLGIPQMSHAKKGALGPWFVWGSFVEDEILPQLLWGF